MSFATRAGMARGADFRGGVFLLTGVADGSAIGSPRFYSTRGTRQARTPPLLPLARRNRLWLSLGYRLLASAARRGADLSVFGYGRAGHLRRTSCFPGRTRFSDSLPLRYRKWRPGPYQTGIAERVRAIQNAFAFASRNNVRRHGHSGICGKVGVIRSPSSTSGARPYHWWNRWRNEVKPAKAIELQLLTDALNYGGNLPTPRAFNPGVQVPKLGQQFQI